MPVDVADLRMVRMAFDAPRLFAIGRSRRLPPHRVDLGYLVHCVLTDLFGQETLRPFWVAESEGRTMNILAYTDQTEEALRERAQSFGDPASYAACRWDRLALKPMPERWPVGRRLGFEIRVCPVVRLASEGPNNRAGAEVDSFLARCWEVGEREPVDREKVYVEWLSEHLTRRGGARIDASKLERFQLTRLLRRTQGTERKALLFDRPDATLSGTIEVLDGEKFGAMLAKGIGRHKAFGFGMLRLHSLRD